WLTRDVAARLAIRNHLPLAKCAHFGQHRTAQALYAAVVARYFSPATAALGRLLLPYLFPELSAFATVEDLVSHLRTSDARYRATVPAEFLDKNQPPMFITLYFIVTRLPDSLHSVRDHFLSLDPTSLTIDLLEQHLLAAETSAVAVGAARGTPRPPFFKGCSPTPLAPSYASTAAAYVPGDEDVRAAFASAKRRSERGKGSKGGEGGSGSGGGGSSGGGGCGGSGGGGGGVGGGGGGSSGSGGTGGSGTGGGGTGARRGGPGGGQRQQHDSCPYVIRTGVRAGQTCGKLHTQHRYFSRLDDAWRAEFSDDVELPRWADLLRSRISIFDLEFDAILSTMYAMSVSAEGDCYRSVPPDPGITAAALGASESGTLPGTAPAQALHTFTLDSGASRCFFHDSTTLTPLPAPVPVRLADPSGGLVVARSSTVLPCPAYRCPPRLCGMHSRLLVFGLPWSLPPLPPSPAPPCLLCVEERQRAAPHSSSFPLMTAPLQTLHMDVWGPARVSGQGRERYFLPVVDDYTRYTTVFPLRSKVEVVDVLIPWIHTIRLQLRERFGQDLPVLRLHSDRGGEFSSNLLRDFFCGEGILQSFTLPDSPQQNGIAERRIGLVMEVARTSMIHAAAPHFLWPFAVRYAAHQLNLWPRVPLPETSPTLRWTGEVGDASVFREPGGVEPEGVEPRGAELGGAESGGAEPRGAASSGGAGDAGAGGAGVTAGAGGTGGTAAAGLGGAHTRGTGVAETGGVGGAGAGDPTEPGAAGAGSSCTGGAGAGGAGVGGTGARGAGAAGAGAADPGAGGAGGTVRPRPYFVPLLQQALSVPSSTGPTPPLLCPPPDQSQQPLHPASPLPTPSPYIEQSGGLTKRREPSSRPASPVCTARRAPHSRPPPVPGTHAMTLHPSSVPLRVPLPAPLESSLPEVPDLESDRARATSPAVSHLLATVVTDPSFESAAASALVAELLDFAAACRLDYATALVAESTSASPPSVGGECALGTDVLEDRQDEFECLATAVPRFASMLLAPEGDPDAPDIPTPRSYAEAITGPYSSQWPAAMDAEMASWKSTGTYVDEVPPADIVDGMWIFRVKRAPGSPPTFKARYVARGFSQRQGVDYFQTFSPTPKMTTLWWHDTLRTTLAALGFAPSIADPSLFLRTNTSLLPFYVLVYIDELVFAAADTEALTPVKSELQKRHTCTDLGELRSYLGLQITRNRARRTITLTQSHMVHQVLQRFGFQFSSPQPTPLSIGHSLSAPPSNNSIKPSGPYPELALKGAFGCCEEGIALLVSTLGMGLVLGGRGPVVLTGHADASWADDSATQQSSQGYTFSLGSGSVSWRSTRSSSVLSSSCEAEIYAGAMAAQELHWLTYLLTDLGEQPRSPPVLSFFSVTLRVGESLFDHTSGVSTAPAATAKSTVRSQWTIRAARGAEPAGAGTGGAEHGGAEPERVESGGSEPPGTGSGGADPGGAEPERMEPGGAEPERVEPGGAKPGGTASWGAEPARAESGGSLGDPLRREPLSPQRLREWYARHCSRAAGGTGPAAGSAAGARATGGAAGAGAAGGAPGAGAAGGAAGAGAAGGAAGAGAAGGAAGAGAAGAAGRGGARTGGTGAGGAAGVVTRDPGAEGTGAVSAVFGGAARPRPYYVPLLQQILGLQPSSGPTTLLLSPPPVQSQSQFQPVSPLPGPSPYSGPTRGLTERREPESRPVLPESRPASLESRSESSRVPLASPPASSLLDGPDPEFNSLRAASPTVTCFLATAVTC
ncbi:unnamed protein product, partial [Closterium sp. NIES-54]